MKMDKEEKKKDQENSTGLLSFLDDGLIEIPVQVGKTVIDAVGEKIKNTSGVLDDVSGTLSSAADVVGEHAGDILEGAAKVAGNVAGGIVDVVGDVISGIDL